MFPIPGLKAFLMNTNLCIHLSYINIVATMFVVDEVRMKSTWRSWLFPSIIFQVWCLTTWLGHPGNHGISNTPAVTTIWFVSHPKVKSFPDECKFMYTSILYCWCVGNSVISQVAQPGGEAPHLEDKKIKFGNNQLLQVDFIRPSSTTCFPSQG